MKKLLVFADAHVAPGQDLRRFDWLGELIVDQRPDAVACLGDIATNDSVSYWSVPHLDKTSLADDVAVVKQAQARMFNPLKDLNTRMRKTKHAQYLPDTILTKGNHEYRLDRRIEDDELGLGSLVEPNEVYAFDQYWNQICDWKEYIEYEGILLTHCPTNGRGKPIDGFYRGRTIALTADKPVLYGHTHKMDFTTIGLIGNENRTKCTLNLPCFMEQDHVEDYAVGSTTGWDYGCVMLTIHSPSRFTYQWISMAELEKTYGGK